MNNQQYMKALEKALMGLDKKSREEILMEIRSHIEELGEDQSLGDRFGPASELAQKYLEGEQVVVPLTKRAAKVGGKIMSGVGLTILLFVLIVGITTWWLSADEFNYADENAPELAANSSNWKDLPWSSPIHINVDQSEVVFYWHDEQSMRWNCKRDVTFPEAVESDVEQSGSDQVDSGKIEFRQNSCLVFLPNQPSVIDSKQGGVVIVRPIHDTSINLDQSGLRIAENGGEYHYEIAAPISKVEAFVSNENAKTSIVINAKQSSVSHY